MIPPNRHLYSASASNLKSLLGIRSLVIVALLLLLWYLSDKAVSEAARNGMAVGVSALVLVTLVSLLRLRHALPVTDREYFLQLCADVLGLSFFLYFSGGANNPFVSYYLVPLVISAAVLPRPYTACIAILSMLGYSLLLFYHLPLPLFAPHAGHGGGAPTVHILGMWANFLVSVGLITWFVVNMASALRRQEAASVRQREDSLRNEQLLAVAGLAAGTAHELGTPLSTMSVLLEDLQDLDADSERQEDYQVLAQQVQRCKAILNKLSRTAELKDIESTRRVNAWEYLDDLLQHWQLLRPDATFDYQSRGHGAAPDIHVEPTLDQAIENLLNNAANACPDDLSVELGWDSKQWWVRISDQGPGIPLGMMEQLGKPVIGAGGGMGLGLLLSHATVERYGGSIELSNRPGGGCRAEIRLPLHSP